MTDPASPRTIDPEAVSRRERYQLLTSLVVPRPIGWISTFSEAGTPNLAPFSYFSALSSSPMLIGVSIGDRRGEPKDTLVNIRTKAAFCVNVVSESFMESMNATSADVPPHVNEFELAGLSPVSSGVVDAPYVEGCLAVLECRVEKEVSLGEAPNTLVIGRVVGLRLAASLPFLESTSAVDAAVLRPLGRLSGSRYALPGEVRTLPRPR
jgi:flavin reductase (DIM6/NTAB) family NADH-FMN oxidoreductase RutF